MACPARLISDSTDQSNESADIEILTDSSDTDEEVPLVTGRSYSSPSNVPRSSSAQNVGPVSPTKSPRKLSEGSETPHKRTRRRGHRGGRGRKKTTNPLASNQDITDADLFSMALGALNKEGLAYEYTPGEFDSDSDPDLPEDNAPTELNRLMSLNEMDMFDSDEAGEKRIGANPMSAEAVKRRSSPSGLATRLEPVGVFWDIENCQVPPDKSAFSLAGKIRREFFRGKREAEFLCVCDITKEKREVVDALNKALVSVISTLHVLHCVCTYAHAGKRSMVSHHTGVLTLFFAKHKAWIVTIAF